MKENNEKLKKQKAVGKVIVLGGFYGALSVVKALGMEGVQVILLSPDPHDHACYSRFVSEKVIIPDPMDDSDELLDILMETKQNWDGALLIPTLDEYVIFVSQNIEKLRNRYVFTIQDWGVINKIINKNLLYPEAQKVAVPAPRIFTPDSVQSLNKWRNEISYPCILKPSETHKFSQVYGKKILMVNNFQELTEKFIDAHQNKLEVMISEIIPGDDSSIFSYRSYIDSQSDVLAEMCTQKLRQYPPGFGQGSVVRTVPMIEEIRFQALKLLRGFSYRGESSAEFRLDYRDSQYKLMEINVRPVVTEWLFVKAGINFPYITYLDLIMNTRKAPRPYSQDLYWIHNYWEAVNFVRCLMNGNLKLREFLRPYWEKKVFAVSFSDDPIHFLIEIYHNCKKALKRVLNRSLW